MLHGDAGSTLWVRCSQLDQSHASIWSLIDAHPFNQQLQTILPQPVPGLHERVQALTGFYYSVTCTLGAFCQAEFIDKHLKEPGSRLQALSVNSDVARGDAVALTPDGWLHLAVSKNTHQYLGLTGRSLGKDRYCISTKLTRQSFKPGNHTHDKVLDRMGHCTRPLTFHCSCTKDGSCSEVEFASQLPATAWECREQHLQMATSEGASAPSAECLLSVAAMLQHDAQHQQTAKAATGALKDVHEWLGAVACGLPGLPPGRHLSPTTPVSIERFTWSGMVQSEQVRKAVLLAQGLLQSNQLPWAAITVAGYSQCPVVWTVPHKGQACAPCSLYGGDNLFTILLLPGGQYILFVASSDGCFQGFNNIAPSSTSDS